MEEYLKVFVLDVFCGLVVEALAFYAVAVVVAPALAI